jgi:hypothetical protein
MKEVGDDVVGRNPHYGFRASRCCATRRSASLRVNQCGA